MENEMNIEDNDRFKVVTRLAFLLLAKVCDGDEQVDTMMQLAFGPDGTENDQDECKRLVKAMRMLIKIQEELINV